MDQEVTHKNIKEARAKLRIKLTCFVVTLSFTANLCFLHQKAFSQTNSSFKNEFEKINCGFEASKLWSEGYKLFKEDKYAAAAAEFTKALALDPKYLTAYSMRALCYKEGKQFTKAIADLKTLISLDPKNHQHYYELADVYEKNGQFSAALAEYTIWIKQFPTNMTFLSRRARLLKKLGQAAKSNADYDRVISFYTENLKKAPRDYLTYAFRGLTFHDMGKQKEALADYDRSIEINSSDSMALGWRGDLYHDLKQYDKALADFKRAIALSPREGEYRYRNNYDEISKFLKLIDSETKNIEAVPSATAYRKRANAYAAIGYNELAVNDFKKAIEIGPAEVADFMQRGQCLIDEYRRLSVSKESEKLHNTIKDATNDFTKVLEREPMNAVALTLRGYCWKTRGYIRKALADLNKAIIVNPESADAYAIRGNIFFELGDFQKSENDAQVAAQKEPQKIVNIIKGILQQDSTVMSEAEMDYVLEEDSSDECGKLLRGPSVLARDKAIEDIDLGSSSNEESIESAIYRSKEDEAKFKAAKEKWSLAQVKSAEATIKRETILSKARVDLSTVKASAKDSKGASAKTIQDEIVKYSGQAAGAEKLAQDAEEEMKLAKTRAEESKQNLATIQKRRLPGDIKTMRKIIIWDLKSLAQQCAELEFLKGMIGSYELMATQFPAQKSEFVKAISFLKDRADSKLNRIKTTAAENESGRREQVAKIGERISSDSNLKVNFADEFSLLQKDLDYLRAENLKWNGKILSKQGSSK